MMNKLALLFLSVVVAANAFVPQQVQHTRSVVALEGKSSILHVDSAVLLSVGPLGSLLTLWW
jgi:hypothetical protein